MLLLEFSIKWKLLVSEISKLLVGLLTDFFLLRYESLLVGDLFSKIEVNLVINAWLLSEASQLTWGLSNISLGSSDLLNKIDLLILSFQIFILECIELSDKVIDGGSIFSDLGKAILLNSLFLYLNLFVLLLEIVVLFLEGTKISLSRSELRNVVLKLRHKEFMVLVDSDLSHNHLRFWGKGGYSHSRLVLVLPGLMTSVVSWGSWSVSSRSVTCWVSVFLLNMILNVFSLTWELVSLVLHALISSSVVVALSHVSVLSRPVSLVIRDLVSILSGFTLWKWIFQYAL